MSKINWEEHKKLIISLTEKGLSSSAINETMQTAGLIPKKDYSRSIRGAVKRWGYSPDRKEKAQTPQARVLVFDTETSHIVARVWGLWKQNINHSDIIKDWFLLCWSAKWLWDDKIYSMGCTPKEIKKRNDKRVVQGIWDMIDEADIVIGHNLKRFDRRVVQTRFLEHRMNFPSPYQEIDTLLHARKKFKVSSNRLDYLGDYLGVGRKIENEKGLWNRVEDGDKEAMDKMMLYCDQDVKLLEDVYLEMRKYIQPHPNLGLHEEPTGELICPTCGGTDLKENGEYHTTVQVYQNYTCNDCGSHSRARKTLLDKEHSQVINSSNPK